MEAFATTSARSFVCVYLVPIIIFDLYSLQSYYNLMTEQFSSWLTKSSKTIYRGAITCIASQTSGSDNMLEKSALDTT